MNRSSRSGRAAQALTASLAGVLLLAACGSDPEPTTAGQGTEDTASLPSTQSSPFTVGPAPDGYRLVAAGTGTDVQDWGSDSSGSDQPYTVLSPDGTPTGDGVVVVALTGYDGQQGGLGQSSAGYGSPLREDLTHDGHDGVFVPAGHRPEGGGWADLVVAHDESVAVRVTASEATRDELLAILDRVTVPDARVDIIGGVVEAPRVDVPGLEVVGSVDSDGAVALRSFARANSDDIPGPAVAHSAGWVGPDHGGLMVMTLPGEAIDVTALGVSGWAPFLTGGGDTTAHSATAAGRQAVVIERTRSEESFAEGDRTVAMEAPSGDVVVARSSWGTPASEEDLLALAASVAPTDPATWDDFVIEATGGPGLHPDDGHAEVTRGTVGDLEWLLQDGPPTGGILVAEPADDPVLSQVDSCLKLSDRTRTCANGTQSSADGTIATIDDDIISGTGDTDLGDAAIVSTVHAGTSLRVTTASEQVTVPLVEVPDGGLWAAVAFLDDLGAARCDRDAGTPPPAGSMRLDVLDADGHPTACIA